MKATHNFDNHNTRERLARVINALAQRGTKISLINIDRECLERGIRYSTELIRSTLKELGYAEST